MHPKVSIVTSTYNGEQYLEEAVGSMRGQTFEDFEFIIVDDGTTDNTLKKLQQMSDPRIRVIQQSNQGQANALIAGIEQAQGELIARIDQDTMSCVHKIWRKSVVDWIFLFKKYSRFCDTVLA